MQIKVTLHSITRLTLYAVTLPLGSLGGIQLRRILSISSVVASMLRGGLDAAIESK